MRLRKTNESTEGVEILILAFIWMVIFTSPVIIWDDSGSLKWDMVFATWLRLFPFLVLSLLNHFILVPFLFFRKMIRYFPIALLTLALFSFSLWWLKDHTKTFGTQPLERPMVRNLPPEGPEMPVIQGGQQLPPPPGSGQGPIQNSPGNLPPYLNSFLIAMLIMGFDTGMRAIFKGSKTEREKEKLEQEKVKSELAFLRNQVSPHFFMNTLNNIHALIDLNAGEAKEAVIRLSKLMQHLLYDSELEKIPLKNEIAFIQSYIELMKLRFTEKVKVSLVILSEKTDVAIPPMLFTSLLENAFKYGVSYQEKSFIEISLITGEKDILFTISNSIIHGKSESQDRVNSGIGLENTRKRLDLLYANRYKLQVTNTGEVFTVTLNLPL